MNLVATTDYKKIVQSSNFKRVHQNAFAKCAQIWNGSRRPKCSEAIGDIIKKQINYPVCTRWNSLVDCTEEILRYEQELNRLLDASKTVNHGLSPFTTAEISYLKEYVILMSPLAKALDYLQAEKNCFYGRLLPTLFTIKSRYEEMGTKESLSYLKGILPLVLLSFEKRFLPQLTLDESISLAVVAAVSHPQFKLRWVDCAATEAKAQAIFIAAVEKVETRNAEPNVSDTSEDFLVLRPSRSSSQVISYLNDTRTDLKMLESYPAIKKVFKSSNTPLCSSAPIERIFNFAGIINNPKRGSTMPKNFEMCVVMKGNQVFQNNEKSNGVEM